MIYRFEESIHGRGLFASVFALLDFIRTLAPEDKVHVFLGSKNPYYDEKEGPNVWDYFFKQPFDLEFDEQHERVVFDATSADRSLYSVDEGTGLYGMFVPDRIEEAMALTREFIHFNDTVKERAQAVCGRWSGKTLGVHIRGGYHYIHGHGRSNRKLGDTEYYYPFIDDRIDEYDQLLIVTPDRFRRDAVVERYGSKVVFQDHDQLVTKHNGEAAFELANGVEKGMTAAVDCALLAECDHILGVNSNLGAVAMFHSGMDKVTLVDEGVRYCR